MPGCPLSLAMRLQHHAAVSVVVSGGLYAVFKSPGLALASFASGVFIDLDHFHDYLREYGWPIDLKEFFHVCHNRHFEQGVLVLHGWEWLALWAWLAWAMAWNPWLVGLLIGFGHHLVLDQFTNGVSQWGYFLLWRMKNGFAFDATFPADKRPKAEG